MDLNFLRKFSLLMLLCTLACSLALAQERRVTGKVTDSVGTPLPGVNVAIRGLPSNVSTTVDGLYTIQVRSNSDVLVFSYVGFVRKQVTVGTQARIDVSMSEERSTLTDVVVVGYGTKKRTEILGSVATVTGQELQDIPAPNLAASLRNRIAGVSVSQVSGRPGSTVTLNIRNSTASETAQTLGVTAEPLYIIDGITVSREAFDALDASQVENLTFLKDASAAIYGASGAKGVVLVTTKRGKIGRPSLTYNGYYGVTDASRTPKMLSAYDHALLLNDTYRTQSAPASSLFAPEDLEYIKGLDYKSWYDELWQASTMQRHNIGLSGGSDKVTFFTGGSYQSEDANYPGLKYDKYSFRSGLVATIVNGLKADIAFNVDWNIRNAQHNQTDSDNEFFRRIVSVPRWVPISIDGKYVNYVNSNITVNPKALIESGYYERQKSKAYRINANLTYQPTYLKGFTARFQISQGSGSTNSRQYRPPYLTYNFARMGNNQALFSNQLTATNPTFQNVDIGNQRVTPGLSETNSYQGFLTLQYGRTFGKHTFDILAGGEQTESNSENLSVNFSNQLIPNAEEYWAFDASTLRVQSIGRTQSVKRSYFGRFSYNFDKKYLIEGVLRADASSNFAPDNRWGLSPSIGLGWVVSNEEFMKRFPFISFLKLKANVGITGDDRVNDRLWVERYLIDISNGYLYGNSNQNSLNQGVIPNPDITWEKKRTVNVGIEASLFNNKLDLSIEGFRNYNYDAFDRGANQLYPLYAGFAAPVINYRQTYNWGTEFSIGYRAKVAKDWSLQANMNFSYGNSVNDRIIYTTGNLINNVAPDWPITFGLDPRKWNTGNIGLRNLGMFRTQAEVDAFMAKNPNYRSYNLVPQPGWLYYEDTNGDGIINDNDMQPLYNNTNPVFAPGITLGLSYKAFNLNTNIAARFGGKVFYDSQSRIAPSATVNVLDIWKDRWTIDNPMGGKYPRFDDPSLTKNSDFWAVNGTMVRINNMTLSYRAPLNVVKKLGLSGARILLTGNNLWTLVNPLKYKDPYTSNAYDYPILRTISVGVNVNL
ncbi:SusC/RagA family TonB-linked outer membrane protein [Mucilaginibacter sp. PAMB04168]|uniref:SusC/RagA family TonB-linked outer membrane protein n=1 Tax=Mucilaginibacter sp. PAMB04168 TaxID=3138567 RepID=UPI0031F68122